MKFEEVRAAVGDTPHTTPERGRELYDFVLGHDVEEILELGFAHGVGSCYLAAALDERGGGRVVAIDNTSALSRRPSIHYLLQQADLTGYVTPIFAETSYTWELMRMLEEATHVGGGSPEPRFDFCFVDGAHTWDVDGFAFFLVDKLLRPGGWLLFDDLDWRLSTSPSLADEDWVDDLPREQRDTRQVAKVFDLLVRQHPDYTDFAVDGDWGWARKRLLPAGSLRLHLARPASASA